MAFFSSVTLTVVLLIIIALASIVGTLIPIFHSLWFMILMILLSLNLLVCSIQRLPASWRLFRTRFAPDETEVFRNLPADRVILVERPLDAEAARLENLIKKRYKRVQRKDTGEGSFLAGEKRRFSYFGVYCIHFSILLILTGMIIGFLFGFDAYVEVAEGESVDTVQLDGGKGVKKLDFTVRCDRFSIDYYEDGTPKMYRSDLTFLKNNRVVYQGSVRVNYPITFEEIRFYQANYGVADMKYYTGLQVNKDPGVPVIFAGSLFLIFGFMTVFFYAHRQVWIRLDRQGTNTRIGITGNTSRDPVGLEREIIRLIGEIQEVSDS